MVGSIDIGIATRNVVGYGTEYVGYREVKYFPNYSTIHDMFNQCNNT